MAEVKVVVMAKSMVTLFFVLTKCQTLTVQASKKVNFRIYLQFNYLNDFVICFHF
jgi:hypothetical protein